MGTYSELTIQQTKPNSKTVFDDYKRRKRIVTVQLNCKRATSLRFRCRLGPNPYNDIRLYITKPLKIDVFPQPGFEVWNVMMASSKSLFRFH